MRWLRGIMRVRTVATLLGTCAMAAVVAACGGAHDGGARTTSTKTRTHTNPSVIVKVQSQTTRATHTTRTHATTTRTRHSATTATHTRKTRRRHRTRAAVAKTIPHWSGPPAHPDLGPFAGYEWSVNVRSVHADWTVPHVTAGSPAGQAAAWVGAEAPGASGRAPFVQVGVHEGNSGGSSD